MKKILILGIIVLFVGAGVIPSTTGIFKDKTFFQKITSRGYIQGLIDNASVGDTIYIPSGIYYENIIIIKSISLIGEDKNTTIIDGCGIGDVVHISACWVNISGFTIQQGTNGINLYTLYSTIERNNISNNIYGINLEFSSNNIITDNTIISNQNDGIYLNYDSSSNTITDNNISANNNNGISLNFFSNNNNIIGNTIISNHNKGIYLDYSNSNTITYNNISSSNLEGISLFESISNTILTNEIISNNAEGIFLDESSSNMINDNSITSNYYDGIYLTHESSSNTINDNTINSNHKNGIFLNSNSNIITSNNISFNNEDGIYLNYDYNTVIGNLISVNNNNGLSLSSYSSSNIITDNTIYSNNGCGIKFDYSSYNIWNYIYHNYIYHNNFIDNTVNAYDEGGNIWHKGYPSGGNYWDDYNSPDNNGDGIGDIPYDIPGGSNQDLYPFIEPNGWLKELKFRKAFIFGKITNLSSQEKYITFEAMKTRVIYFSTFSFYKYVSGEKLVISTNYWGFMSEQNIIVLCEIAI